MAFPRRVRAVIFDVDGVVANSELIFLNSATRYLESHGVHPELPQLTRFLGKSEVFAATTIANEMLEGRVTPEEAHEGIYGEGCGYEDLGRLDPMPGLPVFLEWMRQNDMPAAIATSGTAARVKLVVGGAGCLDAFDVIATVDDTGVCKPDPAIFNVAAERLVQRGIERGQMIAIEDSANGIASAKGAGLYTVGFTGSGIPQDVSQADVVVTTFAELQTLIER